MKGFTIPYHHTCTCIACTLYTSQLRTSPFSRSIGRTSSMQWVQIRFDTHFEEIYEAFDLRWDKRNANKMFTSKKNKRHVDIGETREHQGTFMRPQLQTVIHSGGHFPKLRLGLSASSSSSALRNGWECELPTSSWKRPSLPSRRMKIRSPTALLRNSWKLGKSPLQVIWFPLPRALPSWSVWLSFFWSKLQVTHSGRLACVSWLKMVWKLVIGFTNSEVSSS